MAAIREVTQKRLAFIVDTLVIALAGTLPWSTSATAILAVLWVLVLLPTLRWPDNRARWVSRSAMSSRCRCAVGTIGSCIRSEMSKRGGTIAMLMRRRSHEVSGSKPILHLSRVQYLMPKASRRAGTSNVVQKSNGRQAPRFEKRSEETIRPR